MYKGHKTDHKSIYDLCPDIARAPSVIVDLGAHMGDGYAKLRKFYPDASIHLVEPVPDCVEKLHQVTAGDAWAFVHPYAVGNEDCQMMINVFPSDGRQSSNFYSDRKGVYGQPDQIPVNVRSYRVLPSEIDLAKINIEAGEFSLIETDFFDRVGSFVMEAHNNLIPGKTWRDVVSALETKFDLFTAGNLDYKYCAVLGVKN